MTSSTENLSIYFSTVYYPGSIRTFPRRSSTLYMQWSEKGFWNFLRKGGERITHNISNAVRRCNWTNRKNGGENK